MNTSLRAYLMIRFEDSAWSVSVHRSVEEIVNAWRMRANPEVCTGVLHVGFERPASPLFDAVAKRYPARMLMTAAAKFAVPRGFECSREPVGEVQGLTIFVATRGWGYVQQDNFAEVGSVVSQTSPPPIFKDWVKEYVWQHPEHVDQLRAGEISDETSYIAEEIKLDRDLRFQLGIFRYRSLVKPSAFDPCEIVRASPPWLLDRSFSTLDLSVRISNSFENVKVTCARDLLSFDSEALLNLQNFGRKSLRDLYDSLLEALNAGPYDLEHQASLESLLKDFDRSLVSIDERDKDILLSRMGLGRPAETLQEIGDRYSITRERIRQIESRTIEKMRKTAFWSDFLSTKLEGLLLGREFPLPVLGLDAVDPWFSGIGKSCSALRFILLHFCGGRFAVVRIGDIEYVGRLTDDDWIQKAREARQLLAAGAEQEWSELHCQTLVNSLLDETRREFRPLLWREASSLCHFVDGSDGNRRLASYGRGADQVVEAVLLDSEAPLHYTEIADRAKERSGREIEVRRAHNAAAATGILLGRGIYGLEHHLKLTKEMQTDLQDRLEEIIMEGPDDRQWHASELLFRVTDSNIPYVEYLDKYVIDYVLGRSSILRRLGRMAWTKVNSSMGARIDVRQAITALLQHSNGPLTANEIRQQLIAIRGVGDHFQILSSNLIVRLPKGLWGLNDRDLPLKRSRQTEFFKRLADVLRERGKGIHITEIENVIRTNIGDMPSMPAEAIFSLAPNEIELKATAGEFLFLAEWGESRRKNLMDAVIETLKGRDAPLSMDNLIKEVESRTERQCDEKAVISCLRSAEANYDSVTDGWLLAEAAQVETEDTAIVSSGRLLPSIEFFSGSGE